MYERMLSLLGIAWSFASQSRSSRVARALNPRSSSSGRGAAATSRAPRTEHTIGTAKARIRTSVKGDRKSTRLNSSHGYISYAVFCLKKKKKQTQNNKTQP